MVIVCLILSCEVGSSFENVMMRICNFDICGTLFIVDFIGETN